ncbi:hypothetical protein CAUPRSCDRAFT_12452 [Caulochytrium protostelioides]|nr:hypothetical protein CAUPRSCDRAFT_12452 [Caulochytrium protostelioides]
MRTLVPNAASGNRLHIEGHRVVIELDDYKTVKTYGPQCFVISHEPTLVTQLRRLLEHREPGEPLFCTENRQLYELSAFSRFVTAAISEVVGKHVTVHIARKILAAASWPENPSRNAMERISRLVFQHSLSTHVAYNLGHAGAPAGDAASVHSDLEQSFSDESEDTEGA